MSSAVRTLGQTSIFTTIASGLMAMVFWMSASQPAAAQVTAFKQAVAEAASDDRDLAAFYRSTGFTGIWTDQEAHKARRQALFLALQTVSAHGLPQSRYDIDALEQMLRTARTPRDIGFAEVALSKAFLNLADDMRTGVLDPRRVVPAIKRELRDYDRTRTLTAFAASREPRKFIRQLAPSTNEYKRLMKEKMRLEGLVAQGGWGPTVPGGKLEPGASGPAVTALRNRLMAKGYLGRTATQSYDATIQKAVMDFQRDHGLEPDGVAGESTLREINATAEDRLKSVIVAMERERWLNLPQGRGKRHILVNLTDFSARIMDDDIETFRTRAVIGAKAADRQSPEFSDEMEHMIINPTWHVPRSIAVKEYLPQMKRNRNAAGHMRIVDSRGRTVSRSSINFGAYNARNFPFAIKQPPSSRNALGLVKFMFPNKYNIYLHDTPQKHLFDHETRAYSHGCIRLHQPFDFAYALLAVQEADPKGKFHGILNTGRETKVDLETHVPVHIIYRTAVTSPKGHVNYRPDVYGRDARIWSALEQAGVSLPGVRG
ncbi:peptidoglycan-binding protein [Roseovarius atlanticus]|uniref:Peptidoglycan-binding protein n=1 Tax=Roseovarius atlanticus TaxID=1641875 RepID=A0A0T5P105_9RHOB|nr:L,D-transpeptidase family protein [Roseovarius atlanticus]KRS14774.1 peptidoglycan-binding protein [Roseovarius atlanticus]